MAGKVLERHILAGTPEIEVNVWDNGDVEIMVGNEAVTAARFADVVAFLEHHGQIRVSVDDD